MKAKLSGFLVCCSGVFLVGMQVSVNISNFSGKPAFAKFLLKTVNDVDNPTERFEIKARFEKLCSVFNDSFNPTLILVIEQEGREPEKHVLSGLSYYSLIIADVMANKQISSLFPSSEKSNFYF